MSISAVFFLSIAIGTTGGALLEHPKDLNVTIGQRVILNCSTDLELSVYWYFNGHEIFYGGRVAMSFQTKFTVPTEAKGVYNLVIPSIDDSYNGEYICGDDEGQGERKSAHLYVTGVAVTVADAEIHSPPGSDNVNYVLITVVSLVVGIVLLLAVAIFAVCLRKKRAKENKSKKRLLHKEEAKGQHSEGKDKSATSDGQETDEFGRLLSDKLDDGTTEKNSSGVDNNPNPPVAGIVDRLNKVSTKPPDAGIVYRLNKVSTKPPECGQQYPPKKSYEIVVPASGTKQNLTTAAQIARSAATEGDPGMNCNGGDLNADGTEQAGLSAPPRTSTDSNATNEASEVGCSKIDNSAAADDDDTGQNASRTNQSDESKADASTTGTHEENSPQLNDNLAVDSSKTDYSDGDREQSLISPTSPIESQKRDEPSVSAPTAKTDYRPTPKPKPVPKTKPETAISPGIEGD